MEPTPSPTYATLPVDLGQSPPNAWTINFARVLDDSVMDRILKSNPQWCNGWLFPVGPEGPADD